MGKAKKSKHPGQDKEIARRKRDRERKQADRAAAALMKSQGNKRCIDSVRFVGARESAAARPRWRADVESIVPLSRSCLRAVAVGARVHTLWSPSRCWPP
jgi:hypothetical protein